MNCRIKSFFGWPPAANIVVRVARNNIERYVSGHSDVCPHLFTRSCPRFCDKHRGNATYFVVHDVFILIGCWRISEHILYSVFDKLITDTRVKPLYEVNIYHKRVNISFMSRLGLTLNSSWSKAIKCTRCSLTFR